MYLYQGDYEKAELAYQHSLQLQEASTVKNHPDVAVVLSNLANVYHEQGAYDRAESLYRRACQIFEATLGKGPQFALALTNLAGIYQEQGVYKRVESLNRQALLILETAHGKLHPDAALVLNNLADIYQSQRQYKRAKPLYRRVLRMSRMALGRMHPAIALYMSNLALLFRRQGNPKRAESLYQRGLQIREKILEGNHPDVAKSLDDLAVLKFSQGHISSGLSLFERALAISERRLHKEALGLSEARLASFLSLMRSKDETLYNLIREWPSEAAARRLALAVALLHEGRSVDEIADTSRMIYRHLGETDRKAFERLRSLRTQLAALSLSGPDRLAPSAYQTRLKELEIQGDTVETDIAQRSALLRAQQQVPGPNEIVPRVAAALPANVGRVWIPS